MREFFTARVALCALLPCVALALPACGGEAASSKGAESGASSPAATKDAKERHEKVMAKLDEARAALKSDGPGRAREIATEARHLAGGMDFDRVMAVLAQIDKEEVKLLGAETKQLVSGQKCKEALDGVAAAVKKSTSKTFIDGLRAATEEQLVGCLRADVDQAIDNGEFAEARGLVEGASATVALRDAAWKELHDKLRDGIIARLSAKIDPDLKAARFADAVAKIDAAVAKGDVGPDEQEDALENIRKITGPRHLAAMKAAIGQPARSEVPLQQLDELVRLLKWNDLPKDVAQTRQALGVWVQVAKLHAAPTPKPALRWTYGRVELHRPDDSASDATKVVASAKKVWVLAVGAGLSLVSVDEPADGLSLEDRMLAADGWAETKQLEAVDTIDWLLPGDEIKGQRVFGPFGRDKTDHGYYLGIAQGADGGNVQVKRLTDDQVVTAPRSALRSGRIVPGMKVLTTCASALKVEQATIEREVPQAKGLPNVRVNCPGSGPKDEVLGGITTKPEWLPPRRP